MASGFSELVTTRVCLLHRYTGWGQSEQFIHVLLFINFCSIFHTTTWTCFGPTLSLHRKQAGYTQQD